MNHTSKISLSLAEKLLKMLNGERIPSSGFSSNVAEELLAEGLLSVITRGSSKSYVIKNPEVCRLFISQNYTSGLELEKWIALKSNTDNLLRANIVDAGAHSKIIKIRSFKGFLVSSCEPIHVQLSGKPITLQPTLGLDYFVKNYEHFRIPADVVIVGVENGESFQNIQQYRQLFSANKILFVSRYPQSLDLINWLINIPNQYIHFGDFDLAGIHIYQNEFFVKLGDRASFFVPSDIESRIAKGSSELYDKQYSKYKDRNILDHRLLPLIGLMHQYHKSYEQEGLAVKSQVL